VNVFFLHVPMVTFLRLFIIFLSECCKPIHHCHSSVCVHVIKLGQLAVSVLVSNPDMGLMYLMEKGFVAWQAADVARFLKTRRGLSKKAIGEYISRCSPFNVQVLK